MDDLVPKNCVYLGIVLHEQIYHRIEILILAGATKEQQS